MVINNKKEIWLTRVSLALVLLCVAGTFHHLALVGYEAFAAKKPGVLVELAVFTAIVFSMVSSNLLYHFCLLGHYKRREAFQPAAREALDAMYEGNAPALSVIIPSYKEERVVNWQTMMSAALAEYPAKNVVLLIDDPYQPRTLEDIQKLEETRRLPGLMQAMFDVPAARCRRAQAAFQKRVNAGTVSEIAELKRVAKLYDEAAAFLEAMVEDIISEAEGAPLHHAQRFFIEAILEAPAQKHRALAQELRTKAAAGEVVSQQYISQQYARLVGLHTVTFSSFERKKYANLSHEANKAMNLNSYISLVGKSWKEVPRPEGLVLEQCAPHEADFTIPHADYIDTIDSDTLMLSEYVLRLIHMMEQPGNERLAAVQSPCSSIPGAPRGSLERIAGACIDVQYHTHQGYSHWNASFWVGANAMLRHKALEDIRETRVENGFEVSIYVQDRTVIEDTESSIDLIHKGWRLFNYPARMTFSSMPPDFGSLLIQRRRWANGGLLILPKLFSYARSAPRSIALYKEMFMRFNYLASTTMGCVALLILFTYPFNPAFSNPWLALSAVPVLLLCGRDLRNAGYQYVDVLRACAMSLMLFPIITGGVLKQFQQALTGKKIPFSRTPKIPGRTVAPALYSLLEVVIPAFLLAVTIHYGMQGRWFQAGFALLNAGFFLYSLVVYMGVKNTFEDIFAGIPARLRTLKTADILPMPAPVLREARVPVAAIGFSA